MVIFPIWKFPNGFIIDSPKRIFISTEKYCDVVYTHSHKLYIILETASEEGSLDIIALKTKKTHSSVDTVGVYCNICGRINDVSCFCQSLIQSCWLNIYRTDSWKTITQIYVYTLFSDKQRHCEHGYKLLRITESCLWNNCAAHWKAF